MKITLPFIRLVEVGTKVVGGVDLYFHDRNRANIYADVKQFAIHEAKVVFETVFDKDLQIARRTIGAGRLALMTGMTAVFLPLAAVYSVGRVVGTGIEIVTDKMGEVVDAAGIRRVGLQTFRNLLNEIVR